MKKCILFSLLVYSGIVFSLDDFTNQTILFPKDGFGSYAMHEASWHNMVYNKQHCGSALQIYSYFQTSLPDETSSQYFLFDKHNSLRVESGTAAGNPEAYNEESFKRNILGQWLGFKEADNFKGDFTLTPEQTQYGLIAEFSQDLKAFTDISLLDHLSVGISVPLTYVENKLKFQGDSKILEALQGKNAAAMNMAEPWQYLKLNPDTQTSATLTNVKLHLGTKYQSEDDILIATNTFAIIPLVQHIDNRSLFEPIAGYNGHIVFGSNVNFQIPLLVAQDGLSRICGYFGLENKFLLQNHQKRTFEIADKPYSRYMPIYDRHINKMIPGVNAFTKECVVEPFNVVNFIAGIRFKYKDSVGEIGYELWGHGTETITIKKDNDWEENRYGIPLINENFVLQLNGTKGKTASKSSINYAAAPDGAAATDNVYIKKTDLNMQVAAARTSIVHRGYASLGIAKKGKDRDCFANLGLFIEATQNNAAFNTWGGWFKLGFSF